MQLLLLAAAEEDAAVWKTATIRNYAKEKSNGFRVRFILTQKRNCNKFRRNENSSNGLPFVLIFVFIFLRVKKLLGKQTRNESKRLFKGNIGRQ